MLLIEVSTIKQTNTVSMYAASMDVWQFNVSFASVKTTRAAAVSEVVLTFSSKLDLVGFEPETLIGSRTGLFLGIWNWGAYTK